jgi:ribosomal protein L24
MNLFCHVKKGDKVLINSGQFSGTISVVSDVVRSECKIKGEFFKIALSDLPKRTIKQKKTGVIKQVQRLVHSSNVELLKSGEKS